MFTKLVGYYLTPSDNWLLALIQAEPQKKVHLYMLLQFFTDL